VLPSPTPRAILALADGTVFRGESIGAAGHSVAEIVFNTSMTGYQEILTDPSYAGQIVTLTYPHIGNTGVNAEDVEASRAWASGLVVRDCPARMSNFRATQTLPDYLREQGIVAIAGIDTRKLTRILRDGGAQGACIMTVAGAEIDDADVARALELARGFTGMIGQDLAKTVSISEARGWTQGVWQLGTGYAEPGGQDFHVVAYDFGVKSNILRLLASRGCRITVVPAQTPAADALALNPDGIFLANGPGDPGPCDYAITATREFLARKIPLFGICLGNQLLGLAVGAKTVKMKTGHHGANHPVQELASGRVAITSQNHGFAVEGLNSPTGPRSVSRATPKPAPGRTIWSCSLTGLSR